MAGRRGVRVRGWGRAVKGVGGRASLSVNCTAHSSSWGAPTKHKAFVIKYRAFVMEPVLFQANGHREKKQNIILWAAENAFVYYQG